MITQFHIQNFKAHRDTKLALKQFTMLVGDNGSGKTSVLEALTFLSGVQRDPLDPLQAISRRQELSDLFRHGSDGPIKLVLSGSPNRPSYEMTLSVNLQDKTAELIIEGQDSRGAFQAQATYTYATIGGAGGYSAADTWRRINSLIPGTRLYRFDPTVIAAGSYSEHPVPSVEFDGAQTATVLAALKLGDDEAFSRVEVALRRIVPTLSKIRIKRAQVEHSRLGAVVGNKLYLDFQGVPGIPAHHASQGTLITLALLTMLHGRHRPDLILLDDLDHALHPRAQMELVRMLREVLEQEEFKETQIIATTHSPYILDELPLENVIAFALRDDGTVASKPLSEHPDAAKASGSLKSGELWTLDAERTWVL